MRHHYLWGLEAASFVIRLKPFRFLTASSKNPVSLCARQERLAVASVSVINELLSKKSLSYYHFAPADLKEYVEEVQHYLLFR